MMHRIIYEDQYIIVVDKPPGMLVIPTPKNEKNTLTHLLNDGLKKRGMTINAHPCHRIDRETSGIVVYAKGKAVQQLIMGQFKNRSVKKTYIAFAQGLLRKDSGIIESGIYNKNKRRKEPAITRYKVIERKKYFTVLEASPETGRTNQIRIHLKEIGHPLVGESVYAFRKDFKLKFKRAALHASSIEFDNPATKERLSFACVMPYDMRNFLSQSE